jgi:protein-tyrosine phosphatase
MDFFAKDRLPSGQGRMSARYAGAAPAGMAAAGRRTFLRGTAGMLLMSGFSSVLLSACGGGEVGLAPTPRLTSVENFRDVAGEAEGYATVDGRRVRRGVFYRSNALTLSDADKRLLDALGIVAVYDLRTPGEIARTPDVLPGRASYAAINIAGADDVQLPALATSADAIALREAAERSYVTGGIPRAGYRTLFTQLANTPGAQLFHDAAGADTAGWVAAVLLSIANVPFDVIMEDYLLTNTDAAVSIKAALDALRAQQGEDIVAIETPLFNVQASFLQAGFDQVQASYGTMANYLTQGLGLSRATIDTLRDKLVV